MRAELSSSVSYILLVAVLLVGIFSIATVFFGTLAIEVLTGAFSVVLSGLLVLLYGQQKDVLERQERIMEANYEPMLSYGDVEIRTMETQMAFGDSANLPHEAPAFEAHNYGQGRALNIRSEIVVGTGIAADEHFNSQRRKIRQLAGQANPDPASKRDRDDLKEPFDSLNAQESGTFVGKSYFRFLPSGETLERFQDFEDHTLTPGDYVTAVIVVEYNDILGNSYTDIPSAKITEYIPETPLGGNPRDPESYEKRHIIEYQNIKSQDDF